MTTISVSRPLQASQYDSIQQNIDFLLARREQLNPGELQSLQSCMRVLARGYRSNPILDELRPNVHPKQAEFLAMTDREVMYGGAVGGGKSASLIMAALQYVDVPGYSAILFRRTTVDLIGEKGLLNETQRMLRPIIRRGDCRWSASERSFFFPTKNPDGSDGDDARVAFSYLEHPDTRYNYQGLAFHFVGFDELTQHPVGNYTYLFSRLRKLEDSVAPVRMRSATNPGGKYGEWVKNRFIPAEYITASQEDQFSRIWRKSARCDLCDGTGTFTEGDESFGCPACDGAGEVTRVFVPARLSDNPSLNRMDYLASLAELTPNERAELLHGRWDVVPDGDLFRREWFRYFSRRGDHFVVHTGPDSPDRIVPLERMAIFHTADTASKAKTHSDWTVIATWAMDTQTFDLFLLQAVRRKMMVPDLVPAVLNVYRQFDQTQFVMVEDASSGIGLIQELRTSRGKGINVKDFQPGTADKVSRATPAIIRAEAGQIYLPTNEPPWLADYINEIVAFSGDPALNDDCVDTLSMAAWWVSRLHNQKRKSTSADQPGPISRGPLGSSSPGPVGIASPSISRWG